MRACLLRRRRRTMPIRSFTMWMPASCAAPASRLVPCMKSRRGLLGPAALAKADRFLSDPRESRSATRARLSALQDEHGIWDCTRCNFCVEVCPKDVKPMEAIIRLRRASLERGLTKTGGARHILGFTDLIEQQGRLNEAIMPLKVVGFAPRGLLAHPASGYQDVPQRENPQPIWTCAPWAQPPPGLHPASATCHAAEPNVYGLDLSIS